MNLTPDQLTEEFLHHARKETGVSWRFLNSARNLVRRAFIEVPLERREACMASILKAMKRQAEIEKLAEEAKSTLSEGKSQILALQANRLFGTKNNNLVN